MPYDPNTKRYTPDFGGPPQQQGWVDMGEDQPIDMGPAAGAFKQRFMQKPAGDMSNMPVNNDLPMDMGGMDAGGGSPVSGGVGGKLKGLKSL